MKGVEVNNKIIKGELGQKVNEREQKKGKMSAAEAKIAEQNIMDKWEQEAQKYENISLSDEQKQIVKAAKEFYNSIKKSLTMKDKYDISARRVGPYSGAFFPHSLKENKVAVAWILKVGDNQEELRRLFPNQFNSAIYAREVIREPFTVIDGEKIEEKCSFYPVLTILSYLLQCENWECDGVIDVKTSKPGVVSGVGQINARTALYDICITYTGDVRKPYSKIRVTPRSAVNNL